MTASMKIALVGCDLYERGEPKLGEALLREAGFMTGMIEDIMELVMNNWVRPLSGIGALMGQSDKTVWKVLSTIPSFIGGFINGFAKAGLKPITTAKELLSSLWLLLKHPREFMKMLNNVAGSLEEGIGISKFTSAALLIGTIAGAGAVSVLVYKALKSVSSDLAKAFKRIRSRTKKAGRGSGGKAEDSVVRIVAQELIKVRWEVIPLMAIAVLGVILFFAVPLEVWENNRRYRRY